ncbi:hypothetical protein BH23BAC1_BH23BAC1_08340 [soil metagenome]
MKDQLLYLIVIGMLFSIFSCNDSEDDDPPSADCTAANIDVTVNITNSACGVSEGAISASATGGTGAIQFSLDGTTYQSSGEFTEMPPGDYELRARDANNCVATIPVDINSGISFQASIKPIIESSCAISGCHVAGTAIPDFTAFNNLQSRAAGVKSRTQSKDMPRNGSLTDEQIAQIACWVDDGALNN